MTNQHERERHSFYRIADRLTLIRLAVHSVRRRLRGGEPVESEAVATQLARIDQEVDAAATALADFAPQDIAKDRTHKRR